MKTLRICLINSAFTDLRIFFVKNTAAVWKLLYHLYSPPISPVQAQRKQILSAPVPVSYFKLPEGGANVTHLLSFLKEKH